VVMLDATWAAPFCQPFWDETGRLLFIIQGRKGKGKRFDSSIKGGAGACSGLDRLHRCPMTDEGRNSSREVTMERIDFRKTKKQAGA